MLRNIIQISDLVYAKTDSPAKCSLGALHAKGHGALRQPRTLLPLLEDATDAMRKGRAE